MGYWYYGIYIDATTLKGQKELEAYYDLERMQHNKERNEKTKSSLLAQRAQQAEYDYEQYLWRTSPINLTHKERKDRETLVEIWKWKKDYNRKKRLEKVQWEKKWAWAWGKSYVYFIFDPVRDLIKIGVSSELPNRFKRLQSEYPKIELRGVIPGTKQDENEWHKIFNDFRVEGEWFILSLPILYCLRYFADLPIEYR